MEHNKIGLLPPRNEAGCWPILPQPNISSMRPHLQGVDCPTGHRFSFVEWVILDTYEGFFLMDPLMVLGDVIPDVSNPNKLVYKFRTSHINLIQNGHVKLNETCIVTKGQFKQTFQTSWMFDLQTSRNMTQ